MGRVPDADSATAIGHSRHSVNLKNRELVIVGANAGRMARSRLEYSALVSIVGDDASTPFLFAEQASWHRSSPNEAVLASPAVKRRRMDASSQQETFVRFLVPEIEQRLLLVFVDA